MSEQLSLNALLGLEETDVKQEREERKPVADKTRIVCYAGHKIIVEDRYLTLEDIRKKLERDFPELSKERTEMVYDEKTGIIVPVIKAAKKGCHTGSPFRGYHTSLKEAVADPRPISVVMGRDGLYEVRKNEIGVFCVKIEEDPYLDPIKEGFVMALPKIPIGFLNHTIALFRRRPDEEMLVQYFWDREKKCYFTVIPSQKANPVSVEAKRDPVLEQQFLLVMDVHSHGRMPAFFSVTDDEDEKETRLYAVVGRVDSPEPEIKVRYSCGGRYRPLALEDVFGEG